MSERIKDNKTGVLSDDIGLAGSLLPLWRMIYQSFLLWSQKWDIPSNAAMVLLHLYTHRDSDEPTKIADSTMFPRQTITSTLDTLENLGLACRSDHPNDRRKVCISLTAKGRKLAGRFLDELLVFEADALAKIPPEHKELFFSSLKAYAEGLVASEK